MFGKTARQIGVLTVGCVFAVSLNVIGVQWVLATLVGVAWSVVAWKLFTR